MGTYAIGDVQGCYETLMALVRAIQFDPDRDRIWLAGDLVNRGPRSADVLRWARDHETSVVSVLGNHDVHLLARAADMTPPRRKDTIEDVLDASDRDDLLEWLAHRPFVHTADGFLLLHAGVLPAWDRTALLEASDVAHAMMAGPERHRLLATLSEWAPVTWEDDHSPFERAVATVRILCNMRTCTPDGAPAFDFAGPPAEAPSDRIPWYDVPGRRTLDATVVCGHWAAQGLVVRDDMFALDTGAVWGNTLTAIDLDTRVTTAVDLVDDVRVRRGDS